jgi:hypothetical protein
MVEKFGFIRKIIINIKNWVMGLVNRDVRPVDTKTTDSGIKLETELEKEELEYLFELIKKSNFPGTDLQVIYKIIIKLQNQYMIKTNK